MSTKLPPDSEYPTEWKRPTAFYNRRVKYLVYVLTALGLIWSLHGILAGVSPGRVWDGLSDGMWLIGQMFPPETAYRPVSRAFDSLVETIGMAIFATIFGILLSIPIAFGASENLSPRPIYYVNRFIISLTRAIDSLIVGIIAVLAVGVGPLAGILALSFKTIGFFAKLLAEDIEDIDTGSLEAIRATGGTRFQQIVYGIIPQVVPRFIGLTIYRWDINLRASAIIGVVGAGGIGFILITAYRNYNYPYVATTLLLIIIVVFAGELISARLRRRVR